ncbi:hypothetical protein DFJ43DRAFT_1089668 [Lentinula guzmanii]|uniref:Uncharacterized protein n=1 Tax=Lentinula guzmanii TaxID=2804957 RepID=A0AA38MS99_9AGAR|nr:hypothetical protein DFJ43DRAFT_1089668 [Lentinula guzmanii]
MRIMFIGLLFSIFLVIVNPVAGLPFFQKNHKTSNIELGTLNHNHDHGTQGITENLPDMEVSAPVFPVSKHGTNKIEVDAFADRDCEGERLGTISGDDIGVKELETPGGNCLKFILPMPPQCKLQVERFFEGTRARPVHQFHRGYIQGTMLRGSFESIRIVCADASKLDMANS